MKILLAEDSKSMMLMTSSMIHQPGFEVIQAYNGIEALELYNSEKPDLVLLDVEMPGQSGFEVAKKIRSKETDKWIPIIFLTSRNDDQNLSEGIKVGGDDYLTKPISSIVLNAKLKAMQRIYEMQKKLFSVTESLSETNQKLLLTASTDPLTGAKNRLHMDENIEREWFRCMRYKMELSIVVIDVDNFKTLNDEKGHQTGDDCLIEIVKIINKHLNRTTDILFRYGGDEFIVMLPDTDENYSFKIAEKIRANIEKINTQYDMPVSVKISASIGIATYIPDEKLSADKLLSFADNALYKAKEKGRNCVISAQISNSNDTEAA